LRPLTFAIAKEMLPLGPKPVIQLVAEEVISAGLKDILLVVGNRKEAIGEHFAALQEVEGVFADPALTIRYACQPEPRGLGHAVLCAEGLVEGDFVVAFGDATIAGREIGGLIRRMLRVHERMAAAGTVAVQRVPAGETRRYGVIRPGEEHNVTCTGEVALCILCACAPPYSHEDTEITERVPA